MEMVADNETNQDDFLEERVIPSVMVMDKEDNEEDDNKITD